MAFPKAWVSETSPLGPSADPTVATPVTGAALTDLEQRAKTYIDNADAAILAQAEAFALLKLGAPRTLTVNTTLGVDDHLVVADPTGVPPPLGLMVTQSNGGGAFGPTPIQTSSNLTGYFWVVTAIVGGRESAPLVGNVWAKWAAGANGTAALTWQPVAGASLYNVYRAVVDIGNPEAAIPNLRLVGTTPGGSSTTWTDTGGAAIGGTPPPTTNGGAFTLTLPDARVATGTFRIRHQGSTPNLVTLQGQFGQTIDGKTTIALGKVYGADYKNVLLASDGANWQLVEGLSEQPTITQGFNARSVSCPAGVITPVLTIPLPKPKQGQRMYYSGEVNVAPATGCYRLEPTINVTDTSGAILPGVPGMWNFGYWWEDSFAIGTNPDGSAKNTQVSFSWCWDWNSRAGDMNFADWPYSGHRLTLALWPQGGAASAYSSYLRVLSGPFPATDFGG